MVESCITKIIKLINTLFVFQFLLRFIPCILNYSKDDKKRKTTITKTLTTMTTKKYIHIYFGVGDILIFFFQIVFLVVPFKKKDQHDPVVSRYIDKPRMLADHGRYVCSCLFIEIMPYVLNGWRHDLG